MRIALFIDSKYRDTIGALLLKKDILRLRKDWHVLAVSVDLWSEVLQFYKPDVAIINHAIGERNRRIIRGVQYSIVLPTEGRPNTQEQLEWYTREQDGKPDLFLSWNKMVAERLHQTSAPVVGCPRFDVYFDRRDLVDDRKKVRAKYGIDQDAKVVTVFSSYPQAKFSFMRTSFNDADWKDLGVTSISTRQDPLGFAQSEYRARQRFMTAIDAAAQKTDYTFLVKPHPMEDVVEIQEWCDKNGYVCVTQDSSHNVLAASDLVINRSGCMTTLESWLANKPCYSFGEPEAEGPAFVGSIYTDICDLVNAVALGKPSEGVGPALHEAGIVGPASKNAATAVVNGVEKAVERGVISERAPEFAGAAPLAKAMADHAARNSSHDIHAGQVGKAATSTYISAMWRKI